MDNNDDKKDSGKIISDNLSKNVELYNKYTMLLASIFISALTAIGQHIGSFSSWLKTSIFLFSLSLFATLLELFFLITYDSIALKTINYNFCKKISSRTYSLVTNTLALMALAGFLLGLVAINIFIFTL